MRGGRIGSSCASSCKLVSVIRLAAATGTPGRKLDCPGTTIPGTVRICDSYKGIGMREVGGGGGLIAGFVFQMRPNGSEFGDVSHSTVFLFPAHTSGTNVE